MCEFTQDSWKMYRYTVEDRVFIVQAVTADVLARTFQNMARRVQSCLDANGGPSSTCYDVVTFLTQRTYSCSNFVAISPLVLELLKKSRDR
jgi:hypothetical protein